jgi:hypothetical protein
MEMKKNRLNLPLTRSSMASIITPNVKYCDSQLQSSFVGLITAFLKFALFLAHLVEPKLTQKLENWNEPLSYLSASIFSDSK